MTAKPWYLAIVYLISATGFIMIAMGLLVLGDSTRMGLPKEETTLKTGGIYKFTRNPIYVGLHILLLAVVLYTLSIWVTALAIYSIAIYHLIIQSEERFLKQRFGSDYEEYLLKTSRYIKGIL
jgi:protein-S-isoprenylcysteine O-methyltransferase Ste14